MFDGKAFGLEIVETVKTYVGQVMQAFEARLAAIETRDWTGAKGDKGPPGIDGKDGEPGRDGKDGIDGRDGEKGDRGRNGADIAGATIGRDGQLLITLSNGDLLDLGPVTGRDGFGFDDLSIEHDGERTITLKFMRGEDVKEFHVKFAVPLYRGVYQAGQIYERGDLVTFGGSIFHANDDTTDKPEEISRAWTLAAKRGRDGRNGRDGERGPEGKPGKGTV